MASITIRGLDVEFKQHLRLRAARNGRSMEDEARTILRAAAAGGAAAPAPPLMIPQPAVRRSGLPTRRATAGDPASTAQAPTAQAPTAQAPIAHRVLLIVGGGIAAYKSLDLIRRLKERGLTVRCVLTAAAQQFIAPLSAGALSGERVFTDLFDAAGEFDVGHIRLARETDLVVVAPATADLMAKMAGGHADDLAGAILLATHAPVLIAPAMNPRMWRHAATARNLAQLVADGIQIVGPGEGEMAERGEAGIGRMAEPLEIVAAAEALLAESGGKPAGQQLAGKRMLVTSGPTHEPIDPVRYIANRSSGKQGHAIAGAAAHAGAEVTLICGPVNIPDPRGVKIVRVETAREMLTAVERALPVDCAVFAAAVADWRVADAGRQKIKKTKGASPALSLVENPDILSTIAHRKVQRPRLVIGFAAETENVVANAQEKLKRKGCDWILANDVSAATGIMGGDQNRVQLISSAGVESWPIQSKDEVASALVARITAALANPGGEV